jgi:hypothetical protein
MTNRIKCVTCENGVRGKQGWECLAYKVRACQPLGAAKYYKAKNPQGGWSNALSVSELRTLDRVAGVLLALSSSSVPFADAEVKEAYEELHRMMARYA